MSIETQWEILGWGLLVGIVLLLVLNVIDVATELWRNWK